MAWMQINDVNATDVLGSAFFERLVDNLLASGASVSTTLGDIVYGVGSNEVGILPISSGAFGTFVSVGTSNDLVWGSGASNLSYRRYINNPALFISEIEDDANISKLAGLSFIEAFDRVSSPVLVATMNGLDVVNRELTTFSLEGNATFSPVVELYTPNSLHVGREFSTNSSELDIEDSSDGPNLVFPDDNIRRLGVIVVGSTGIGTYKIIDVSNDNSLLFDFQGLTTDYGLSNGNNYRLPSTWRLTSTTLESLQVTNSFTIESYSSVPALGQVTGLVLTPGRTTMDLSWNEVVNASGYEVEYGESGINATLTQQTTSTSITISGLTEETVYLFRVRAIYNTAGSDNFLSGQWSDQEREATQTPVLDRVTGVSISSIGTTSFSVSWTAVTDATSYTLQWRTSSQSFSTARQVTTNATSRSLSGLSSNTAYFVRVKATASGFDDGPWSLERSATTLVPRLSTPVISSLSALSSTSIRVIWGFVNNADRYVVRWRPSGGSTSSATTTSTSYTISGLSPNTTYFVSVQADSTGIDYLDSFESSELSVTTNQDALSQVGITSITSTRNSVSFSWGSVTNAASYRYQWRSSTQSYSTMRQGTTTSLSATISSLTSETTYYVRVRATASGFTDGAWSSESSITTDTSTLGQVSISSTSSDTTSISFSWSSVTNANSYTYQWRTGTQSFGTTRQGTTTNLSATVSSLQSSTLYYVRVRATASGYTDGAWSSESSITTDSLLPVLAVPDIIRWDVDSTSGLSSLQASAQMTANNNADQVITHTSDSSTFDSYVERTSNNSITTGSFDVVAGTRKYFRIKYTASGYTDSPWTATRSILANTGIATLADPTGGSFTSLGSNRYRLSWSSVTGADGYQVVGDSSTYTTGTSAIVTRTSGTSAFVYPICINDGANVQSDVTVPDSVVDTAVSYASHFSSFLQIAITSTQQVITTDSTMYGTVFAFVISDNVSTPTIPLQPRITSLARADTTNYNSVTLGWQRPKSGTETTLEGLTNELEIRYRNAFVEEGSSRIWKSFGSNVSITGTRPASGSSTEGSLSIVNVASDASNPPDIGYWLEFQIRAVNTSASVATLSEDLKTSPWSSSYYINTKRNVTNL